MRYRREQQHSQLNRPKEEEGCSWNNIIVWGICASVTVLIVLYISFGPNLYHPPPVLVGSATVSTLTEEKKAVPVHESTVNIEGVGNIFYRYTEPRGHGMHMQPDVLLLHGAKYASQTWKGLGTLQILGFYGYRSYAIDLPGYRLSKKATPPSNTEGYLRFMEQIIDKLHLSKVVVIAPSMSGKYGLPLLIYDADKVDLRGFIAIAPESANKFTKSQYQSVQVPVLVMYGEKDRTALKEESLYYLENIPNHNNVMISKAEHAAFVGNPEDFHKEILRFLSYECTLGEETDTENELEEVYDDEVFGYRDDTDADYYDDTDDTMDNADFEQYLREYFDDDKYNGDYYDDTEMYFDNAEITEDTDTGTDALETDTYVDRQDDGGGDGYDAYGDEEEGDQGEEDTDTNDFV
eukprot:CAMPEP_0197043266 /NCGR_PEP_ID=MMETSP1384-20130603/19534_1 /TAXON_ID=29189 /ORGANISM="Ammonia sp." /LENGTH=406 /DNA_ID=CAMNT_0042474535 /DNA_START=37 /DNA_END=1257 /DNA_ORIENTATION=+